MTREPICLEKAGKSLLKSLLKSSPKTNLVKVDRVKRTGVETDA